MPGNYPAELVIPMDFESQFFSLIVDPINRLLTSMKVGSLNPQLKRAVTLIPAKGKKAEDPASLYPLYAVNSETMEHSEVPEKFWKIIGNPEMEVSDLDTAEYIEVLTRYGLDTIIVPKLELDKYLKRIAKKIEKSGLVTDQLGDDDNI
jgi:hypothetical protein